MKKLTLLLLILCSVTLSAQRNIAYLGFQPVDKGIAVRYDHYFSESFGLFGSVAKGQYILSDDEYIKGHYKLALGYTTYIHQDYLAGSFSTFTIGPSYHIYKDRHYTFGSINEKALNPVSFDIGVIGGVRNFAMGFMFDFFKGESVIYAGWRF